MEKNKDICVNIKKSTELIVSFCCIRLEIFPFSSVMIKHFRGYFRNEIMKVSQKHLFLCSAIRKRLCRGMNGGKIN